MAGADQTPCGPDRDRAIFFDDFICGRIGKEANPALGTGLGHSRQILERMKCRLTGVTQRMAGSIAGFIPGSFQAVYNGTKAFLNSFSFALRKELKDTEITVTCLMPGATETEFFRRAEMMDTAVGTAEKDDPTEVANNGFDAMMKGEGDVVSGLKNKVQSAAANVKGNHPEACPLP